MSTTYSDDIVIMGVRDEGTRKCRVTIGALYGDVQALQHLVHHSPDGFEWGYAGSGPADLALAILAAAIGPETETVRIFGGTVGARAFRHHQIFKNNVVAGLHPATWQMTIGDVRRWLAVQEQLAAAPMSPEVAHGLGDVMRDIGRIIDRALEDARGTRMGFALLVFNFGEGGEMSWISNAKREEMLVALNEFITKNAQG